MSFRHNPYAPLSRCSPATTFKQTYNPHLPIAHLSQMSQVSQMSQMSQMSHMSREQSNLKNKYYELPVKMENQRSMLNLQNNSADMVAHGNGVQTSQDLDESDIGALISPVILKAYSVLKECQLKPDSLDQIQRRLKQKLKTLQKYHETFNEKMLGLIKIGQQKLAKAKDMMSINIRENGSRSIDQLTKRQGKDHEASALSKIRSKSYSNVKASETAQKKGRRNRAQKPIKMDLTE